MSAATALALEETQRRNFPRHPLKVPLDLIALRSGVPENLPGRCTDLGEGGVGAVVAGELSPGQQVAIELRLPNVGLPLRARALVRYQKRLHCGLEFVGLSVEQQEMIRYWFYASPSDASGVREIDAREKNLFLAVPQSLTVAVQQKSSRRRRRFRFGRREVYALTIGLLLLASLAWWQWQRSWNELEKHSPAVDSELRVLHEPSSEFLRVSLGRVLKALPQRSLRFTKETGRP